MAMYLNTYNLIDFAAQYQKGFRNNIIQLSGVSEMVRKYRSFECYSTYFLFPAEIRSYMNTNLRNNRPSLSGYGGRVYATYLPVDIDSEDLSEALDTAKGFVEYLDDLGISEPAVNAYFSGSKGFHIMIDARALGEVEPAEDLHMIFSEMRRRLSKRSGITKCIDYGIKDKTRLLRLPNTINKKTNLYKIPLRAKELFKLSVNEIKRKARTPANIYFTDPSGLIPTWHVEPNEWLSELYNEALATARTRHKPDITNIRVIAPSGQWEQTLCPAERRIFESRIPKGYRNECAVRLLSAFRLSGTIRERATELILSWNKRNDEPLPKEELLTTIGSVYNANPPYSYGCLDHIISRFCPFDNISKCRHYRRYKAFSMIR